VARLKRGLGLFDLTMIGIGLILGAGIYVMVGEAAVYAYEGLWLSFLIGGIVSAFTALSYAELASMFPKDGSSFLYATKVFKGKLMPFLIGWLIYFENILGAATVSLGFAQYLATLGFSFNQVGVAITLVGVISLINFIGVKFSSLTNMIATVIEATGLVIVIIVGFFLLSPTISIQAPSEYGFSGILIGSAVVFFAYLGFEIMAESAEEVRKPRRNIPRAILISVAVCTFLYVLVAISFTSLLPYERIVQAVDAQEGPIAVAMGTVMPQAVQIFSLIALFSTANTALLMLLGASRLAYGMSSKGALPKKIREVHPKFRTPYISIFISGLFSMFFCLGGDLGLVGLASVVGSLVVFALVNYFVIYLRIRPHRYKRAFSIPISMGRYPVIPILGIGSSFLIIIYSLIARPSVAIIFIGLIILGYGFYEGDKYAKTRRKN
jgi:APA family basic amino acid/polyamine antiporter